MNMIALEIELGWNAPASRGRRSHRAVTGVDHRLDERGRPQQAPGIRHAAAGFEFRRALFGEQQVACPQCGSQKPNCCPNGSHLQGAWRCKSCREPFDYFKCH